MRDGDDRVALHYAAEVGDEETFQRILDLDPSLIDCQDHNGYTPFLLASMSGNISAMELLAQRGTNINHFDKDKHSAVHWAVVCGEVCVFSMHINYTTVGAQPLHYATVSEDVPLETSAAILHVLLKNGANVNAVDFDGRTPLLWAACNGNPEAIIALLQAGASRTVVDRNQLGVLHCAASQGHANALHILIQSSEQSLIDSVDRNGDTPLFYAVSLGHYECAKLLLTSGANPNQQDNRLKTPSHCAAAKGQLRLLKMLKHYGASFEIQNRRGDIPLHEAIQAGCKDIIEWLLSIQPSTLNATNHAGRSGLHLAAATGNMEIVVLLCTKNAEIDPLMLSDGKLYTPLDLAEIKGHEIVADYLRRRHNARRAEEMTETEREEWTAHLEEQIDRGENNQNKHHHHKLKSKLSRSRKKIFNQNNIEIKKLSQKFKIVYEASKNRHSHILDPLSGANALQAREAEIFQELTNLKKAQIQYGKLKEKSAVRTLIRRFCRKHELNPTELNFLTYNSWEKFLHEQLRLLYAEEKKRLLCAKATPSFRNTGRQVNSRITVTLN
ncbi:unnamed protein product [Enterobius vermicularis]|uniref:ANK_REP_REGION domain-containing protein n=1 Tax=Enterobius vermicularis TaxID=51028 RepID=A0A0N4V821_ENTVE|nr:unnamed protein product [Enterobius vermicularis]